MNYLKSIQYLRRKIYYVIEILQNITSCRSEIGRMDVKMIWQRIMANPGRIPFNPLNHRLLVFYLARLYGLSLYTGSGASKALIPILNT